MESRYVSPAAPVEGSRLAIGPVRALRRASSGRRCVSLRSTHPTPEGDTLAFNPVYNLAVDHCDFSK